MKVLNYIHGFVTDQEVYEGLKKEHLENPELFLSPAAWKKMRLAQIKENLGRGVFDKWTK